MRDHQRYSHESAYLATGAKPLFLLHNPKTAGTTLLAYFVRLYGQGQCGFHYRDRQSIPLLLESLGDPAERCHHRASHLSLAQLTPYLDQIGIDQFHWLTCVREPMARKLSLYHYMKARQHLPEVQRQGLDYRSLEAFIASTPTNSQCRFHHPAGTAEAALEALDRLNAQIIPVPFLRTVIDALYSAEGVAPLAPIHVNQSSTDDLDKDISATARAMIAERFQQDQLLYDLCLQRVAPLLAGYHPARAAVETLADVADLERLRSITGPLHIFGTSAAGQALYRWLDQAGIRVSGFLDSRSRGEILLGRPVLRPGVLDATRFQHATVLIAAETYGPVYRLLAAHGGGRIIDAFDLAKALMPALGVGAEATHPQRPVNAPRLPDTPPAPPGWPAVPAPPPATPPAPAPAHRPGGPV